MTHLSRTVVILALSLGLIGVALAQNQPGQRQDNMTRPGAQGDSFEQQLRQIAQNPQNAAEKLFILGCSQESQFEVEVARQALTKAQNPQVKQLAQQIVQDHQQSRQRLQQVARELNVDIPEQLSPMHQQILQIYSSVPAEQYDKWFATMTQAHHAKALIANRAVAQIAQNPQVKQFAEQELTMLSKHYDQAQQAAVALGLPSGGPEAIPAAGRIPGNPNTPRP
jgi:putative membrane protein